MAQGQQEAIARVSRAVQQRFGLPDGFATVSPFPFSGMNQQASRLAIADPEFYWLENLIKIGDGNVRAVPDKGTALYAVGDSRTIINFASFNLGNTNYFIVFFDDGSALQVNAATGAVTTVSAAASGAFYKALGAYPTTVQWGSLYLLMSNNNTPNDYWAWDGSLLYTAGTISPQISLTSGGSNYISLPTLTVFGGHGSGIALTPVLTLGSIVSLIPTNPGAGYLPGDIVQVRFAGGGSDDGARLHAELVGAALAQIVVLEGGTGYNAAPTVGFSGGGGSGAAGTAVMNGTSVGVVTITNPGSGYNSAPTVTFTPVSGGSGALAAASLVASPVNQVVVDAGGTKFTGIPALTLTGGFGTGATAVAVLGGPGPIASITVTAGGSGYTSLPTIAITDGGAGAGATAVVSSVVGGVILGITVTNPGSGYTSPVVGFSGGGGSGAAATAAIGAGSIVSATTTHPGSGYKTAPAVIVQSGLNNAASATLAMMPFGVSGDSIETYNSEVWIQNPFSNGVVPVGGVRQSSAAGSISDFATSDGGLQETVTDRFLRRRLSAIRQSNGFLYPMGDSSVGVISNVQVQGNPPTKTLTNTNTDPQTGTHWRDTVQDFSRTILFANPFGVFGLFGGAVTKISGKMDRIFQDALFPTTENPTPNPTPNTQPVTPSGAVANLYNRKVYLLLARIRDPFTGQHRTAMVCWNEQEWSIVSQSGNDLTFIGTQEINSNLMAWGTDGKSLFPLMAAPSTLTQKILSTKLFGAAQPYMTKLARMVYVQCENFASDTNAPLLNVSIDTEYAEFPANTPQIVFPPPGAILPASASPPPVQCPLLAATAGADISGQQLAITIRSTEADFAVYNLALAMEDSGPIFA